MYNNKKLALTEELIQNVNKNYNFKYKTFLENNTFLIDTVFDEWCVEYYPERTFNNYELKHKNKNGITNHYHEQRKYNNLKDLFYDVNKHKEKYNFKNNNIFKFKNLLDSVGNTNKKK